MKDGNYLKEKVTEWKENSHYTVEIYETSMPIKNNAKATLGVRPLGNDFTEAFMKIEMTPKYKILQPMMFLMFRYYAAPALLRGLENLYKEEHKLKLA